MPRTNPTPSVQVGKGVGIQFYVLLRTWLLLVLVIRAGEQFTVLLRRGQQSVTVASTL